MRQRISLVCVVAGAALLAGPDCQANMSGSSGPAPPAAARSIDYDIGKVAAERGDFATAIGALKRAVSSQPRNVSAFNLLGYATRKSGDARSALPFYLQALAIDPKHIGAHEYIGEAYLMLDDVAQARQHLDRLEQLCLFGCKEHRMLQQAIAAYNKGVKPK
ncbi:MAG TPA: tetratricopeptide repeat protein [Vineibacter sp.]|nr:tetratricopeptide repeat protein [Vineibacter sp.]